MQTALFLLYAHMLIRIFVVKAPLMISMKIKIYLVCLSHIDKIETCLLKNVMVIVNNTVKQMENVKKPLFKQLLCKTSVLLGLKWVRAKGREQVIEDPSSCLYICTVSAASLVKFFLDIYQQQVGLVFLCLKLVENHFSNKIM